MWGAPGRVSPSVVCRPALQASQAKKADFLGEEGGTHPGRGRQGAGEDAIRELLFPTWLDNVVLVPKPTGTCQMCTDFTNINKACQRIATLYQTLIGW
ncbi:hypothetical protein LIER_10931 [Lithospermum erythrorhizon]|uniref:Uncharacterized protein n=1 Tax=Lithospermum erythrorhizon TaxID=34254 RepID=A0AAV3PQ69_LITER